MASRKGSKNKIKIDYGNGDFYRYYTTRAGKELSQKTVFNILRAFFAGVLREIIYNMYEYSFFGLFRFRLESAVQKPNIGPDGKVYPGTITDWSATLKARKETGKHVTIYYNNEHTNYKIYRIMYYKSLFLNKTWYKFKLNAVNRSKIAEATYELGAELPAYDGLTPNEYRLRKRTLNDKKNRIWKQFQYRKSFSG